MELREAKLKSLTMSHKQSAAKATPVRTTKLAYVESVTKAPRGQVNSFLHSYNYLRDVNEFIFI